LHLSLPVGRGSIRAFARLLDLCHFLLMREFRLAIFILNLMKRICAHLCMHQLKYVICDSLGERYI
jgi:hypothetical protein